jgi:hypothetical protein
MVSSLEPHGIAIVAMPSLESQAYASPISRAGHVNCKTMPELRSFLELHFHNVFVFSMNDEVVHTGYHKWRNICGTVLRQTAIAVLVSF